MVCSIDLLSYQELKGMMNKKQETKDTDKAANGELVEEIKEMNRRWYQKKWLVILSLILSVTTFIGGFYVEFDSIWQSAVQTVVFIISAGFFVLVLSYVFNVTWMYALKKKSDREYMLSVLLQVFSIFAIIPNIILVTIRYTTDFILTDVRGAYLFTYYKNNYSSLLDDVHISWKILFSGDRFWFQYHLGVENTQLIIVLIVIYSLIIIILGFTTYTTIKKMKKSFNLKDHLRYLLDLFLMFYYGIMALYVFIQKQVSAEKSKKTDFVYLRKFSQTVIFLLVPLLFVGLFFALYLFSNFAMEFLLDSPWPLFF